jgi:hypothetical protein
MWEAIPRFYMVGRRQDRAVRFLCPAWWRASPRSGRQQKAPTSELCFKESDILTSMDVRIESRRSYVLATLTGPHSLEEALKAYELTYDTAFNRGLRFILVDCSGLDGALSTRERFILGKSGVDYWSSRSSKMIPKIAVVGKPPVVDGLGAVVASSGGIEVQTFPEVQEALKWLGVR